MILTQYAIGTIPKEVQLVLDHNRDLFGTNNYDLIRVRKKKNQTNIEMTIQSDLFRFEQAAKDPEFFFACWDLKWFEIPKFNKTDAPYLLAWKGRLNQGESAALYCNGFCDFFAERLDIIKTKHNSCYAAQMKVLREIKFNPINQDLFFHKKENLYRTVNT